MAMQEYVRPITSANRDMVMHRLRRIEGQVRGVQRMVEAEQDCRKIMHQLAAIKAALNSLNGLVLECYAQDCLGDSDHLCEETVNELIHMMVKSSR